MKTKLFFITIISLLIIPVNAFAINTPTVEDVPPKVNDDVYILKINTEVGATITVVGGSSNIPPMTDGTRGDKLDGYIEIMVGLAQEQINSFSIIASKDDESSDSVSVTIHETADVGGDDNGSTQGDTTSPDTPVLNSIPESVDAGQYRITGSSEPNAKIYARNSSGVILGKSKVNSRGKFGVSIMLERGKTNRINISAEDEDGNEGQSVQAVIRVTASADKEEDTEDVELKEEEPKEIKKETTSSKMPFNDAKGHWAESYIQKLYDKGAVKGKSATAFAPNDYITRAELTKIALNTFGYSVSDSVIRKPFADVPKDAWFAVYVEEAKKKGIVKGYTDGFHPTVSISRAAALKILIEASGLDYSSAGSAGFKDVPKDAWFAPYITFAKVNDIVGGYSDGTFRPHANITRAEAAKMATRILEIKE